MNDTQHINNETLRNIIKDYGLRHKDIVMLLTSEYGTIHKKTVESWLYNYSVMPGPMLELLIIKLKGKKYARNTQ